MAGLRCNKTFKKSLRLAPLCIQYTNTLVNAHYKRQLSKQMDKEENTSILILSFCPSLPLWRETRKSPLAGHGLPSPALNNNF